VSRAELQLLHRWLDNWIGLGLTTLGVERRGMRLPLSHIAIEEWREVFMSENGLLRSLNEATASPAPGPSV
jgi:hypothetical protein